MRTLKLTVGCGIHKIHVGVDQNYIKGRSLTPWFVQTFDSSGKELKRYLSKNVWLRGPVTLVAEETLAADGCGYDRKARIAVDGCYVDVDD